MKTLFSSDDQNQLQSNNQDAIGNENCDIHEM